MQHNRILQIQRSREQSGVRSERYYNPSGRSISPWGVCTATVHKTYPVPWAELWSCDGLHGVGDQPDLSFRFAGHTTTRFSAKDVRIQRQPISWASAAVLIIPTLTRSLDPLTSLAVPGNSTPPARLLREATTPPQRLADRQALRQTADWSEHVWHLKRLYFRPTFLRRQISFP